MLLLMFASGADWLRKSSRKFGLSPNDRTQQVSLLVGSMASAQILIVLLTFTSYHVQIITRLSSGYPIFYFWVAERLSSDKSSPPALGRNVITFMVMYAAIQGALFASFLPPA
jgi:GPI mannosyltransferase 2